MNFLNYLSVAIIAFQSLITIVAAQADEPFVRANNLTTTQVPTTQSLSLRSSITRVQPMTGIVLWSDHEQAATDAIALEFRYCGYNEVVQPDGTYDYSLIDEVLDDVASRGHQAILRFYFVYPGKRTTVPEFIRARTDYRETVGKSEGRETSFCDWSNQHLQEFVLDFYTQFAKRYDQDRRVAFLQTGFGLWAEYHIYDGPLAMGKTFPSKAYQARFLKHLDQSFTKLPWSISVDAADSDYTPLEDNAELLALGFGVFDDSFLCKPHPQENALNWKALDLERWRRTPAGGEFSYYNQRDQRLALSEDGPNGVSFREAARQYHISYMIGSDQPSYQTMARIAEAGAYTGYRFRVTAAQVVDAGIKLSVVNEGVAPIYRDAYFAIAGQSSDKSLKGLLPGESVQCIVPGANADRLGELKIECDSLLPQQSIQFAADL